MERKISGFYSIFDIRNIKLVSTRCIVRTRCMLYVHNTRHSTSPNTSDERVFNSCFKNLYMHTTLLCDRSKRPLFYFRLSIEYHIYANGTTAKEERQIKSNREQAAEATTNIASTTQNSKTNKANAEWYLP